MIPNIIHFIFGLEEKFGNAPFSLIHFLAILSAKKVNNPEKIYFHYAYEPEGKWWEKAKPYLTLNKVVIPEEIFGNKLTKYAHKADVLRLEILKIYGGIYLDIDVICINPLNNLFNYQFVLGIERDEGFCNAVILSAPNSEYISKWYKSYEKFNDNIWGYYSVTKAYQLFSQKNSNLKILDDTSFFFPMYNDPFYKYLWNEKIPWINFITRIKILIGKYLRYLIGRRKKIGGNIFNDLFMNKYRQYEILSRSYCIHLWSSMWWDNYLSKITKEKLLEDNSNFCKIIREIFGKDELQKML